MAARKPRLSVDEIETWHSRISAAEEALEKTVLPRWKNVLKDFSGEDDGEDDVYSDSEVPDFNFLLATSNVLLPSIISADPYLRFLPRRPGDEEGAKRAEAAVNYVLREIGIRTPLEDVALDCVLFGIGYLKVGYDPSGAFLMEEDYESGPEQIENEEDEVDADDVE